MNKPINKPSFRKQEKGQSLIELALSFTLLLLLAGGAVDLGRGFFTFMALRDAAQEGALFASYAPTNTSGIAARIRTSSSMPVDLSRTDYVSIDVSTPNACAGNPITITVTFEDFKFIMPLMSGIPAFDIPASITDTILSPVCP